MTMTASGRLPADPLLRAAFDYWASKCRGRPMPHRSDIDPTEMDRPVLPIITLFELHDGGRIRCRLVGTEIVHRLGGDPTGLFLDQFLRPGYLDFLTELLDDVRSRRAAIYSESLFENEDSGLFKTNRILLPLAWNDRLPGMVMTGQVVHATRGPAGPPVARIQGAVKVSELMREVLPQG